jgi:calmodulin
MMTRPAPGVHSGEYELREAFRCIDLDGSGYISKEELKDMVQKIIGAEISEKEIDEMMDEADIDGDNLISFDEFVKILVEKRF